MGLGRRIGIVNLAAFLWSWLSACYWVTRARYALVIIVIVVLKFLHLALRLLLFLLEFWARSQNPYQHAFHISHEHDLVGLVSMIKGIANLCYQLHESLFLFMSNCTYHLSNSRWSRLWHWSCRVLRDLTFWARSIGQNSSSMRASWQYEYSIRRQNFLIFTMES